MSIQYLQYGRLRMAGRTKGRPESRPFVDQGSTTGFDYGVIPVIVIVTCLTS